MTSPNNLHNFYSNLSKFVFVDSSTHFPYESSRGKQSIPSAAFQNVKFLLPIFNLKPWQNQEFLVHCTRRVEHRDKPRHYAKLCEFIASPLPI
jgi:hypothetical protein